MQDFGNDRFNKIYNKNNLYKLLKLAVDNLIVIQNELQLKKDYNPFDLDRCKKEIVELGQKIIDKQEIELSVDPLSPEQSKFFKEVYLNTPRIWKRRKNV